MLSASTIRSLMRQSGSRMLQRAYWSHDSSTSEQAVMRSGPSIAAITSATEMAAAGRASS